VGDQVVSLAREWMIMTRSQLLGCVLVVEYWADNWR
jgi:hypothetical protein